MTANAVGIDVSNGHSTVAVFRQFTKNYQKWCKSEKYNFSEEKAAEIYAAWEMVILTPRTELHELMVRQASEQVTAISKSVEIYCAEMDKLASQLPEHPVVMGMYAVGKSLGPQQQDLQAWLSISPQGVV